MRKINLSTTPALTTARPPTLRIKSKIKAGVVNPNHNETPTTKRGSAKTR